MNPQDLAAAMTPDVMEQMAKISAMMKAKRKTKAGPGGIGARTPSARRMATDAPNEGPAIQQFLQAFGGGMPQ